MIWGDLWSRRRGWSNLWSLIYGSAASFWRSIWMVFNRERSDCLFFHPFWVLLFYSKSVWGVQISAIWHYFDQFKLVTKPEGSLRAFGVKERLGVKRRGGWSGSPTRPFSFQCQGWQCQPQAFNECVCLLVCVCVCVGTVRSHCEVTCDSFVRNMCLPTHSPTIKLMCDSTQSTCSFTPNPNRLIWYPLLYYHNTLARNEHFISQFPICEFTYKYTNCFHYYPKSIQANNARERKEHLFHRPLE